jgi:2-oxoglutarate ferredoxin oxidoreductase subunit delta
MKRKVAVIDPERCKGCGLCVATCKRSLIELSQRINPNGVHYAEFAETDRCTGCMQCAVMCPDAAIQVKEIEVPALAAQPVPAER